MDNWHKAVYVLFHLMIFGFFCDWASHSWYRRWKGGVWRKNRYRADRGRVYFVWERRKGGYEIVSESYL